MTTATMQEAPGVKLKDLRAFPRGVSTAIAALVNNRGVKYRIFKDGNHLVLYPPDRDARPFKVSAHRSEEANLRYLTEFVDKYLGPVPTDDRPAKPAELAPLLSLNTKPPEQRAAPDGPWRVHHRATGEPTTFETNGKVWRCTHAGCSWTATSPRLIGPHAGNHKSADLAASSSRKQTKPRAKPWEGRHVQDKTPLDDARVRELRDRSGQTWGDIGRQLGITPEGIRQWLKRGECASVWVEPFAQALGVTPEVLTGSDPLPPPVEPDPISVEDETPDPEPAEPETPPVEPAAPVPTGVATGVARDYLSEILRVAKTALGEADHGAEIAELRAENAELRRELDTANAKLDLMREAIRTVDEA